jgi:hypothetical protein
MKFDFGEVLTSAWKIIWKHRILWVFGIFAGFARGGGGGGGGGGGSNSGFQNQDAPFSQLDPAFQQFGRYIEENWWVVVVFILVIFLVSILFYSLGIMGRIGLIKGVYKVENGAETLTFPELWSESMPYFWRIFGINFLIGLAVLIIIVPLVLLGVVTAGVGFVCLLPLICILVPISWVVSIILEQAQPAIIIEDLSMLDGFKRGWEIVKTNALNFFILALIVLIGGGIIGFVIAIPIVLAVVPLVLGAESLRESLTPVYIALACCALYLPVILFLNGLLTAYIQSIWTLTYLRLTKPNDENKPIIAEANA